MRKTMRACALLACVVTAACGGGGDGGSSAPTVPDNGSTPTPTPAPAPTPAPTYETAFDFSRDRSFGAVGAETSLVTRNATTTGGTATAEAATLVLEGDESKIGIVYQAAPRTLQVNFRGDVSNFAPDTNTISNGSTLHYVNVEGDTQRGDNITFYPLPLQGGSSYFFLGRQEIRATYTDANPAPAVQRIVREVVAGSPTLATDLPTSGTTSYQAYITGSMLDKDPAYSGPAAKALQVTIDHASGRFTVSVDVAANFGQGATMTGTVTFTGTIDAGGRFNGTVTTADSRYSGTFVGRYYGPQGVEFGLAYALTGADNSRIIGTLSGRKG